MMSRAQAAAKEQAQVMFPSSIRSWASRAKERLGQPIVARKEKMSRLRPPRRHELSVVRPVAAMAGVRPSQPGKPTDRDGQAALWPMTMGCFSLNHKFRRIIYLNTN